MQVKGRARVDQHRGQKNRIWTGDLEPAWWCSANHPDFPEHTHSDGPADFEVKGVFLSPENLQQVSEPASICLEKLLFQENHSEMKPVRMSCSRKPAWNTRWHESCFPVRIISLGSSVQMASHDKCARDARAAATGVSPAAGYVVLTPAEVCRERLTYMITLTLITGHWEVATVIGSGYSHVANATEQRGKRIKPQPALSLLERSSGGCTECTWWHASLLDKETCRFVCMYIQLISSFYDFLHCFVYVCTCATVHMWRSVPSTMWLLGLELSMSGLTANACTCWAISEAFFPFYPNNFPFPFSFSVIESSPFPLYNFLLVLTF